MYCKDCKFREKMRDKFHCINKHIVEFYPHDDVDSNKCLIYSYDESGCFYVGEYFGCIHFEQKENII